MSYNLEVFSQKLRSIRKSLKLHKDYIADKTGISVKTIVRLENGKCLPNLDTLELLSPLYKTDLVSLLQIFLILKKICQSLFKKSLKP